MWSVPNMPATAFTKFSWFNAVQEWSISGYSGVISTVSSPQTFNADIQKRCVGVIHHSGSDTCDYEKSRVATTGQLHEDSAVLPLAHAAFEKHFPIPSLKMTFLLQRLWLKHETMNESVCIKQGRLCPLSIIWT